MKSGYSRSKGYGRSKEDRQLKLERTNIWKLQELATRTVPENYQVLRDKTLCPVTVAVKGQAH